MKKGLRGLSKQGVLGVVKTYTLRFCEEHVLGKYSRIKFNTTVHRSEDTLEYINSNL